ncbi:MAG TPA: ribosomal-processing cysteine protease Prp [Ruminococcaceae bacterium]|nr:ribosomal-processing cysteine protease Prp [Oscillospiraceae bacterium]
MTKVVFFADSDSRICGFEISGHSTEAEKDAEGKIVCSAVSSAAYMTANTVSDIIGDEINSEVLDGYMRIIVKHPSEASQKVLEGFKLHISELSKQYQTRITTLTEV